MSDSGLKLPSTTELEGRVREALKEAQYGLLRFKNVDPNDRKALRFIGETSLARIARILEDGRS